MLTTTIGYGRILRLMTQWIGDNKQQNWRKRRSFFISIYDYFLGGVASHVPTPSGEGKLKTKLRALFFSFQFYFLVKLTISWRRPKYTRAHPTRSTSFEFDVLLCQPPYSGDIFVPIFFFLLPSLSFFAHHVTLRCVCVCVSMRWGRSWSTLVHINQPQQKLFARIAHLLWMEVCHSHTSANSRATHPYTLHSHGR